MMNSKKDKTILGYKAYLHIKNHIINDVVFCFNNRFSTSKKRPQLKTN